MQDVQYQNSVKQKCTNIITGLCNKMLIFFELFHADTDSFIYGITGLSFYEKMLKHKEHIDLSNFPKGSKYFSNDNKKVPGKMKDEYAGKIIYESEFFLKSKIYSLKTVVGGEKSTHKVHNSFLMYDEYEYTRFNKEVIRNNMRGFKSKNHQIFNYQSNNVLM